MTLHPLALLGIDFTSFLRLAPADLRKRKRKLLAEFDLSPDNTLQHQGQGISKDDALRVLEELERKVEEGFFKGVEPDGQLARFLELADLELFTDPRPLPQYEHPYFKRLLLPFYATEFDKAFLAAFQQNLPERMRQMAQANLFREPRHHERCFRGTTVRLARMEGELADFRQQMSQIPFDFDAERQARIDAKIRDEVRPQTLEALPEHLAKANGRLALVLAALALEVCQSLHQPAWAGQLLDLARALKPSYTQQRVEELAQQVAQAKVRPELFQRVLDDPLLRDFLNHGHPEHLERPHPPQALRPDFLDFIREPYQRRLGKHAARCFRRRDHLALEQAFRGNLFAQDALLDLAYDPTRALLAELLDQLERLRVELHAGSPSPEEGPKRVELPEACAPELLNALPKPLATQRDAIAQSLGYLALSVHKLLPGNPMAAAWIQKALQVETSAQVRQSLDEYAKAIGVERRARAERPEQGQKAEGQPSFTDFIERSPSLRRFLESGNEAFFQDFAPDPMFQNPMFLAFIRRDYLQSFQKLLLNAYLEADTQLIAKMHEHNLFRDKAEEPDCFTALEKRIEETIRDVNQLEGKLRTIGNLGQSVSQLTLQGFMALSVEPESLNALPERFQNLRNRLVQALWNLSIKARLATQDQDLQDMLVCGYAQHIRATGPFSKTVRDYCQAVGKLGEPFDKKKSGADPWVRMMRKAADQVKKFF